MTTATRNTHVAMVMTSVPPTADLIAAGPLEFCRERLAVWLARHPLTQYQSAEILARVEVTS